MRVRLAEGNLPKTSAESPTREDGPAPGLRASRPRRCRVEQIRTALSRRVKMPGASGSLKVMEVRFLTAVLARAVSSAASTGRCGPGDHEQPVRDRSRCRLAATCRSRSGSRAAHRHGRPETGRLAIPERVSSPARSRPVLRPGAAPAGTGQDAGRRLLRQRRVYRPHVPRARSRVCRGDRGVKPAGRHHSPTARLVRHAAGDAIDPTWEVEDGTVAYFGVPVADAEIWPARGEGLLEDFGWAKRLLRDGLLPGAVADRGYRPPPVTAPPG